MTAGIWIALLGGSYAFSRAVGVSFPLVFGVTALALLVNGVIATIEDDSPGGFNNPDGTETPAYVGRIGVGVRVFAVVALLATAVLVVLARP